MQHERPGWDMIWMDVASSIAKRSYDPRFQVGSIVVSEDNTQVLAVGYNGNYSGGPHVVESKEPGKSGFIHAEINSLLKMDYNNPKRKKMYLTLSPCRACAKAIINAGINEVIYKESYRDMSGVELLLEQNVSVRQYDSSATI